MVITESPCSIGRLEDVGFDVNGFSKELMTEAPVDFIFSLAAHASDEVLTCLARKGDLLMN
jgi:hypothetical protein